MLASRAASYCFRPRTGSKRAALVAGIQQAQNAVIVNATPTAR